MRRFFHIRPWHNLSTSPKPSTIFSSKSKGIQKTYRRKIENLLRITYLTLITLYTYRIEELNVTDTYFSILDNLSTSTFPPPHFRSSASLSSPSHPSHIQPLPKANNPLPITCSSYSISWLPFFVPPPPPWRERVDLELCERLPSASQKPKNERRVEEEEGMKGEREGTASQWGRVKWGTFKSRSTLCTYPWNAISWFSTFSSCFIKQLIAGPILCAPNVHLRHFFRDLSPGENERERELDRGNKGMSTQLSPIGISPA